MVRLFPVLVIAFKVWMLVDAKKRRLPDYWYYIIFLVPFGGVYYFFKYKINDYKFGQLFKRPPSLAQIEYNYKTTPSLENRITLAQALYDARREGEAARHFKEILERHPENEEALHGLGLCHLSMRDYGAAIVPLAKLIELRPSYKEYSVWAELARAQWEHQQRDDCLTTLRKLCRISSRTDHQLTLVECLVRMEKNEEARRLVREALEEYDHSPSHVKRLFRSHAARLRELEKKV